MFEPQKKVLNSFGMTCPEGFLGRDMSPAA